MASRKLKIRRQDACAGCGAMLAVGTPAWWDPSARTITCIACADGPAAPASSVPAPPAGADRGQAGASLDREYERRRRNREQRTRSAHPHLGGLLLALRAAPQHEVAFRRGAIAERAVAESLSQRTAAGGVITLHNRRMPQGCGDIDHIAIAPAGVYVIDTKDWTGKVEIETPWFGAPKLVIRRRDCTKFIDGLERQIAVVRAALEPAGHHDVSVQGALCFTQADLPWLRTQTFRGHLLLYQKALVKRLNREGPLDPVRIERIAHELAAALPPAR